MSNKKKLVAMAFALFSMSAHAEINRDDYPSYTAYIAAISEANASAMDRNREAKCEGVPSPRVGEKSRSLYCAGAKSAGGTSSIYETSSYYETDSAFYIVEDGRIVYVRNY